VVELTLALHRVFDSPKDRILWDTGHQAYVHKLLTRPREGFARLRKLGGMSGYPNRTESEHDFIENSHASTGLSYAAGMAEALRRQGQSQRVVVVVGDKAGHFGRGTVGEGTDVDEPTPAAESVMVSSVGAVSIDAADAVEVPTRSGDAAAALVHHFALRDSVLRRMLPGRDSQ